MLSRLAARRMGAPSRAPAVGLTLRAHVAPVDAEEHHRLHAHRLGDLEHGIDIARLPVAVGLAFGQVLRTQPEGETVAADVAAIASGARWRHRQHDVVAQAHAERFAGLLQPAGQQVHGGRADEAGNEAGRRSMVEIVGRPDLLDAATVHHHHAVGERHRLDLVVGDVDGGGAHLLMHALDLGAHLHAQLGVEVRQRLVEQEDLRIAHDRAPHGDALALAAGELARLALEQLGDVEDAGGLLHAARNLVLRVALEPQAERHVFVHGHVRVERVVLEHHGHVAVLRRHVVDHLAVDRDLARADLLEPGDHPQRRRFAAAGRAHQHHEFLVRDVEVDAAHRLGVVEALDHLAERDLGHDWTHSSLRLTRFLRRTGSHFAGKRFIPWWRRR